MRSRCSTIVVEQAFAQVLEHRLLPSRNRPLARPVPGDGLHAFASSPWRVSRHVWRSGAAPRVPSRSRKAHRGRARSGRRYRVWASLRLAREWRWLVDRTVPCAGVTRFTACAGQSSSSPGPSSCGVGVGSSRMWPSFARPRPFIAQQVAPLTLVGAAVGDRPRKPIQLAHVRPRRFACRCLAIMQPRLGARAATLRDADRRRSRRVRARG